MITITEFFNRAVDYIMEHQPAEGICKELRQNPVENVICERHCEGLDQFCVKRLLKHYKPKKNG